VSGTQTVIIGGGISGLSAAYYLSKAGAPSTIIERRPRLGGVIETEQLDGCVLEGGPDSYLSVKPAATQLIREVGLGDHIIGSNDHLRVTYIWRNGRLVPLPDGLMMIAPTKIAPLVATNLLSWSTKIRMGLEYLRRPKPNGVPDRSVAEFITDHYGVESLEYLAEPLLSGVYGGDPGRLSALSVLPRFVELETKYGSLSRGILKERSRAAREPHPAEPAEPPGTLFRTLRNGLGELVDELSRRIAATTRIIYGNAEALERAGAAYRIRVNGEWLACEHIALACPAYESAALLRAIDGELAQLLDQVEYSSSLTLSLVYDKTEFGGPLNGFGFLVPKRERERLVACTWVHNKFSHRAPDDKVILRCFFGGVSDPAILSESDESLSAIAKQELRRILRVAIEPRFAKIARWPRSMAQYTVGHQERVKQIEARVRQTRGLDLAGNAYYGIGIPDCVKTGRDAARRIIAAQGLQTAAL
jgi:oxygen-dependent protoporphyrinogen oxidase